MKCNKMTIGKFTDEWSYMSVVSNLIHTFQTAFYYILQNIKQL